MSELSIVMRACRAVVFVTAAGLLVHASASPQTRSVRGFTSDRAVQQEAREQAYRALPKAEHLREHMRAISEAPHHAGHPNSRKVAEYILGQYKAWGLNAWIEEHEALMPMPTERVLEMVAPEKFTATLKEPAVPEDKDSGDADQLPTFNAYAADGDVTGELVYVNYGIPEDYDRLAKLGIDVKGRIVIARYGRSWRGIKPKVAAEHGAIGCLIYSDPKDDGYHQGDIYPQGAYRPWQGVQRGSVMDMPVHPGDPLTPGWGAEKGGRKLDRSAARTLLAIPVLPISYGDAMPLLRQLTGPVAPEDWRGALPITYHVGAGPARVHLKLAFDWQQRPLYNVLARIDGTSARDEWILSGNHHDAWVNGASDPTSGTAVLMETARSLGELVKQGWRPARSIVFASWDGEEWGLLGSTEWAEKHAGELQQKAVVYINTDSTGKGTLSAGGSHSLQRLVGDLARAIADPKTGKPLDEQQRARRLERATTDEERGRIAAEKPFRIEALGSGSDYTVFLDHLTIASLNVGFGGDDGGGVYHSIYDSFEWYKRFSDGEFVYGRTLSQFLGTAILRLADADVLPFVFTDYADTIGRYVDEVAREAERRKAGLDLQPVRAAVERLRKVGAAHERALDRVSATSASTIAGRTSDLAEVNRLVYTSERQLARAEGLPRREWFRHLVYAPGFYTGYGVKTLPGIREGLEQGAADEARTFVPIVAAAIDRVAGQVEEATRKLDVLTR